MNISLCWSVQVYCLILSPYIIHPLKVILELKGEALCALYIHVLHIPILGPLGACSNFDEMKFTFLFKR